MKRSEREFLKIDKLSYTVIPENEDWAKHGCSNNEEWHIYLKRLFERDLYSDLVDGCYVGVLPETKKALRDSKISR